MEKLKLSIIVPIYNVRQYLRKCVESLLVQDDANYEIILVDDGSTDDSGKIADELSQRNMEEMDNGRCNPKIRVIHQENMGLSGARNTGLRAAQGMYIQFVDSDDYLEPNVLGRLLAQMEREDLDVLRFDYQNVRIVRECERERYEVFEPNKTPHVADKQTDVVDGITYLNERMGYACYATNYIVKRDLLLPSGEENVLFTEGLHFEDVDWTPRMLVVAKRVNSTTTIVYDYLHREGSITQVGTDVTKQRKNLDDRMHVVERLGRLAKQYPTCDWMRRMQSLMAAGVIHSVVTTFPNERRTFIQHMRQWRVFPLVIANQGKTYARRAWLMNISTALYGVVVRLVLRKK